MKGALLMLCFKFENCDEGNSGVTKLVHGNFKVLLQIVVVVLNKL